MNQVIDKRIPMPDCLTKQPLVFGNREQIWAIEDVERIVSEASDTNAAGETKKQYRVSVTFEATEYVTVWAHSEKEAEELAVDEIDDSPDLDVTAWASEVKADADKN